MKNLCRLLSIPLLVACFCVSAFAQVTMVFQENFDRLPLGPPVDEDSPITQAFTHQPPDNWRVESSGVPGVQDPDVGVTEWEGWSFANKNFWIQVSNDERRSEFLKGEGIVAVADPDEWNDLGFPTTGGPANVLGFYNTFLVTPRFDIGELLNKGDRLQFKVDSSWIPQCCDDGEFFAPNLNNKTATIRARFDDGSTFDLLEWQSAPFIDSQGNPSTNPNDLPNQAFKSIATNEELYVDLSDLLSTNHVNFFLEFGLTNAGDDWWWAMDNMQIISTGFEVDGDMDLSGVLDELDITHFAQAIHNEQDYIVTHYGESPAVRGSLDSTFDFDDIDWFVGLLNGGGIAATRDTIVAAINAYGVPEPSSGCLALGVVLVGLSRHRFGC